MPTITEIDIFSFVQFGGYTAQTSGTIGIEDFSNIITPDPTFSIIKVGKLNTTSNVTPGFNVYYKIQGYNSTTQKYEVWHSMGAPLMNPPSGNALTNVAVVATWIDR